MWLTKLWNYHQLYHIFFTLIQTTLIHVQEEKYIEAKINILTKLLPNKKKKISLFCKAMLHNSYFEDYIFFSLVSQLNLRPWEQMLCISQAVVLERSIWDNLVQLSYNWKNTCLCYCKWFWLLTYWSDVCFAAGAELQWLISETTTKVQYFVKSGKILMNRKRFVTICIICATGKAFL